jgi:hypothetical protein
MYESYDGRPNGAVGRAQRRHQNQEFTVGTAPSDYTFGGILGTQEINTRASIYRTGTRITVSGTNTISWRMMGIFASGMSDSGWAWSAGKRYAQEGYFDGTTYDGNSLFLSVRRN